MQLIDTILKLKAKRHVTEWITGAQLTSNSAAWLLLQS